MDQVNKQAEERAARSNLELLIAQYFELGVNEGFEGRSVDSGNVAQRKLNEIREAIDALSSRPVQGGDDGVEAAPVSEEHEQALDEAIGLARLPVIRVPLDLRDWLAFRAEETGKALQAVVRELLDEASMLSSAPAQPVREPMWQPIETAPKDGRKLLLWWAGMSRVGRCAGVGAARDGGDWWQVPSLEFAPTGRPTHWMPLPAAPGITKE
jgi:hypothetical protein